MNNEGQIVVGHVIELSKKCSGFLRDYGEIETGCTGAWNNRGEGKILQIPVEYRLTGNLKYCEKFLSRLKRRESTCHINISDVKKWQT